MPIHYNYSTLCAEGFILNNDLLTVVCSLVGSSGAILSYIMCRAMNRDLANVLFGGWNTVAPSSEGSSASTEQKTAIEIDVTNAARELAEAKSVIIVPGYGMAVAKAQYPIKEIVDIFDQKRSTCAIWNSSCGRANARSNECPISRSWCTL